ncbi:MAG: hypothetical protein HQL76_06330 [Magnetococcales bacterium]|nr:hypothetical protein [Magnetococcales bacterium]
MIGSIISATLSQAEMDFAWSGTFEVTNPASFQRIRIDDPIDLELGGEIFKLIVDNKTLERDGVGMPRLTVSVISPTVRFTTPRATPLDRVWDSPVWARDAAEESIGEAVEWDLVNWLITGGRLAVHEALPLDVVRTITAAVGGLVESLPDGTLRVRHRFPVAVPAWATANVDHVLTDESDNLSCRESHILRTRVNKVLVRGYLPSGTGFLSVEVDSRPDGLNHGRTSFFAGDTAHLLVHAGDDVALEDPLVSAGVILPGGWQVISMTQDLVFNRVATATLDKPAIGIDSVIWIGNDLGDLTLESDNRTVSVPNAGVAIARVTYRSIACAWGLSSPSTVAGLSEYPVQVHFSGTTGEVLDAGEIFCQRGDGAFRGTDISDPLLTTDEAKRSRGRAEIDAGESLQEVSLTCLHRPGFMPGQLVEVHDALMGLSWRGKITSVSHFAAGAKLITSLELLRYVQPSV